MRLLDISALGFYWISFYMFVCSFFWVNLIHSDSFCSEWSHLGGIDIGDGYAGKFGKATVARYCAQGAPDHSALFTRPTTATSFVFEDRLGSIAKMPH